MYERSNETQKENNTAKQSFIKSLLQAAVEEVKSISKGAVAMVLVFIIVSVALLVVTRPIAAKYLNSRVQKTNVDSLIGTKCYVTECVNNINQTGKAVVNGLDWTVRADDDREIINQGELVEIVRVCGVKLIVRKVKEDKLWKEN